MSGAAAAAAVGEAGEWAGPGLPSCYSPSSSWRRSAGGGSSASGAKATPGFIRGGWRCGCVCVPRAAAPPVITIRRRLLFAKLSRGRGGLIGG